MKTEKIYIFIILLLFTLAGCKEFSFKDNFKDERPLARVNNQYLYLSDIQSQYPGGLSETDSIFWLKNTMNTWVRQQLILDKAEKNLSTEQKDFTKQINEYRNSLLIYEYENRLFDNSLDTLISQDEIEEYYNSNSENFKLRRNIVKAIYFSMNTPKEKELNAFKKIINNKTMDFQKLDFFCVNHQISLCYLDTTQWIYFDDLINIIPIKIYNEDSFLKYNKRVEFTEGERFYFVNFFDYRLKEESVPLEIENENIKRIILNQRKNELIREIRKQIYEDAEMAGTFEIY